MPFFEDLVKGCFVRIGIGQNEGRSIYRVSLYMLFFMGFFYIHLPFFAFFHFNCRLPKSLELWKQPKCTV